MTALN